MWCLQLQKASNFLRAKLKQLYSGGSHHFTDIRVTKLRLECRYVLIARPLSRETHKEYFCLRAHHQ